VDNLVDIEQFTTNHEVDLGRNYTLLNNPRSRKPGACEKLSQSVNYLLRREKHFLFLLGKELVFEKHEFKRGPDFPSGDANSDCLCP